MEEKILYISLALLFLTIGAPANAQTAAAGEDELVVVAGAPLTVECPLRVEARAEWRLNGSAPPADMRPAELAAPGRLLARLRAAAARAHHQGLYTCSRERAAHRVRVRVLPAGEAEAEAAAATGEVAGADDAIVLYYELTRNLTINCTLTSSDNTLSYVWKKNNDTVDKVTELKNRHKLEQGGATLAVVGRATEDDWGQYSCALGAAVQRWDVRGRPVVRLPDNTNVVEGQKLKLQCRVLGRPAPPVAWLYNGSDGNSSLLAAGDRVRLEPNEQGVPDAALVIDAAARGDAGVYECRAGDAADHTVLRVKDMYAALWPFLGICAEVFVLCAIILVYEKRRTKPEMEDSDTDNHDQKKS